MHKIFQSLKSFRYMKTMHRIFPRKTKIYGNEVSAPQKKMPSAQKWNMKQKWVENKKTLTEKWNVR